MGYFSFGFYVNDKDLTNLKDGRVVKLNKTEVNFLEQLAQKETISKSAIFRKILNKYMEEYPK